MKRLLMSLAALVLLAGAPCYAQERITKVYGPREVRSEMRVSAAVPKEIEGLQWNRWTSKNFVVCSLNDTQAQYLHKHLELVKGWVFARWGLYDIELSANDDAERTPRTKLICVDDPVLFKKLFNIDSTRVEVRRDENGRIKESVIFLLLNGPPSKCVPGPLTEVCMAEFAQKYNTKFGLWATRGMTTLNGSIDQIRERIAEIKPLIDRNEPLYFSKGLMEMDRDQYAKLPDDKKRLYDNCSMMFCLLVRKEFGQDLYLKTLKAASEGSPEAALRDVLKFNDYGHFDRSFKRFMTDLSRDVAAGKTPDAYLQIKEK